MTVAITAGSGVKTMAMKVPHPTPCCKLIRRTPFVGSLPQTVNMYICVRKVLCRSILAQIVLSEVPFVGNIFH
jgi:hypothetical protein